MARCVLVKADTVRSLRIAATALALIAAVTTAATAPVFAAAAHPSCPAKRHDCAKAAAFTRCCCDQEQSTPQHGAPAQPRVELPRDAAATPVAVSGTLAATHRIAPPVVHTSPPHQHLVDLPTLFSVFLI